MRRPQGQVAGSPSGVDVQSWTRIRAAISPLPSRKSREPVRGPGRLMAGRPYGHIEATLASARTKPCGMSEYLLEAEERWSRVYA